MDIFPRFLCVPNFRFGIWFPGVSGTHLDVKLAKGQYR